MSGKAGKEARRQEDVARQNEEAQNILNQFLSQLVPGSEEFNRMQTEGLALVRATAGEGDQAEQIRQLGSQLVSAQQSRIAAGGPATALESRTGLAFQGLRDVAGFKPEEQALLNALRGIPGTGEAGMAGGAQDIFGQLVSRAQDPNAAFTSTLGPQLQLLQDQVKARAAQRGILGSGLELEDLGRTGVELAIREASAREDFRQRQLENFQNLFNAGQTLRGREIGLEEALLNLQTGRESNLTSLLQSQTGISTENLLRLLERQTGQATADRLDAADAEAARRAGLGKALGTTAGAGLGFLVGGPVGAGIGAGIGGGLGGSLSGGSAQGLYSQQQATGAQGQLPPSAGLSRRSPQDDEEEGGAA